MMNIIIAGFDLAYFSKEFVKMGIRLGKFLVRSSKNGVSFIFKVLLWKKICKNLIGNTQ